MARATFVGRHRAALASGCALVLTAGAVVVYAVTADGYKSHQTDLNDGGVWVVNGDKGIHGRINKPINQLDGIVYDEGPKLQLDIVQDGAAVVTLNRGASRGQSVEPSLLEFAEGGTVAVPPEGDVQMAGGTLASLDASTGKLWAVRFDPQEGRPLISSIDRQAEETADVGEAAALAVSTSGTVVATSGVDSTVSLLTPSGSELAEPTVEELPDAAGSPTAVTTVGERVVTLDQTTGELAVLDGARVLVPEDSILQQPGPSADAVLVATSTALISIDLDTGDQRTVAEAGGGAVEPVRLGACVYGAWSGGRGAVAVQCSDQPAEIDPLGGKATNLVFRVNRSQIVLNDADSGRVWDIESKPLKIDNWSSFTARKKVEDEQQQEEQSTQGDRRPPKAKDDTYGVRPGRTTVLHPLDNDSAPEGRLLSVVAVDQPGGGSRVSISPDGQTVQISMPEDARPATFDYYIDDGRSMQAHATVRVGLRQPTQNERPEPRTGYEPRQWHVPAGGSMSVPVLSDWRDDNDGDSLMLDSAFAVDGASTGALARSTAEGRIRFSAPANGSGVAKVQYAVSDGRSEPVKRTMTFEVQPATDRRGFPPVAEPDVVRGEVGEPIEIRPLANDLPGSDPSTPQAELAIGGRIPGQADTEIRTDLESGVIRFEAAKPGTYFLDYDAAYGNAPLARSKIRVDVRPRPRRPEDPVAMPDTLMIYGQSPALIDVLANDLDPSGALLVVQRAEASTSGQLDLAIVNGRWLRVSARGQLTPTTQIVRYTVTNGEAGATGELSITQRDQPADNSPVTATDRVVVRAGAGVTAPVLDNDASPSGDRLSLRSDVTDRAGELDVVTPPDYTGEPGRAFVSGRMVRFVAPQVAERETFSIPYAAVNAAGDSAPGRLLVTIVPAKAPNTRPEPPTLEGRAVAGEIVTVRLRGSEVDPEGDPVTITGITSAPRLGRLLSFTANSLRYQAYPRAAGTDEFEYAVVDTHGAVSTGAARVAVVEQTTPQPPLAVDDVLTVQPSRTATFDPLANDHVSPGDDPVISLVGAPSGVDLDEDTGLVRISAPKASDVPVVQVVYSLSNGLDESRATMTLRTAPDVENPPLVYDSYGNAEDSQAVAVDVLEGAYDPDGSAADLKVVEVYGDPETVTHTDSRVRAVRTDSPQVIPFRVEDGQGTSASAQVFVPPTGQGIPYVKPDALIELDSGASFSGSLADFVVSPSGGDLRLTGRQGVSASPTQLSAQSTGAAAFEVRSGPGFRGPGAVLVEVTTAVDVNGNEDASDDSDGQTALLSIPVQVGDDTPEITCPDTILPLSPGEENLIDVQTLCEVWTRDPGDAARLDYIASWTAGVDGLDVTPEGGSVFRVSAGDNASGGVEAVLELRAGESNVEQITFRLARAPQPRMLPVNVPAMKAGEPRTLDLAPYLVPGVASPSPRVVSITQLSGEASPATPSGSSVTLRPSDTVNGRVVYRVVMSDIDAQDPPAERRVEGRLEFEILGLPGAPTEPIPYAEDQTDKIRVGWYPPRDTGGSAIRFYEVMELRTRKSQNCQQNECYFRGLKPGVRYRFKVRAHNAVDFGPWSEQSKEAFVDTRPGRVRNVRMAKRGDGSITLAWDRPLLSTSKISKYAISWQGGTGMEVSGDRRRASIPGLDNDTVYTFSIQALNDVGWSEPRLSPALQPLGFPAAPLNVSATDLNTGNAVTTVRVAWTPTSAQGPGPALYTVYVSRDGGSPRTVPGCDRIQATTCNDTRDYDGLPYVYTVRAQNQPKPEPPNVSPLSTGALFEAVGKPASWGSWSWIPTGTSQEVQLTYSVPDSRGSTSRVEVLVDGVAVRTFNTQRGEVVTRVGVGSNEQPWPVELRVCNEQAPSGCSTSPRQDVQSFGDLTSSLDDVAPAAVNGKTLTWNITGTSNGNAAVLDVSINGGSPQVVRLGAVGRFAHQVTFATDGFDQDATLNVTLRDDDPAGRGQDWSRRTDRSGPPPPPSVSMRRGAACNDTKDSGQPACALPWQDPCVDVDCGYLHLTVQFEPGAERSYYCRLTNSGALENNDETINAITGNYDQDTYIWYDAGRVGADCGPSGQQPTVHVEFGWPNTG